MSFQAVDWVLRNSAATGAERLVLVVIAHHVNAKDPVGNAWEAWPGRETIAREAGLRDADRVRRIILRLVADGHLERVVHGAPSKAGTRPTNLYRIPVRGTGLMAVPDTGDIGRAGHGGSEGYDPVPDTGGKPRAAHRLDPVRGTGRIGKEQVTTKGFTTTNARDDAKARHPSNHPEPFYPEALPAYQREAWDHGLTRAREALRGLAPDKDQDE